MSEIREGYVLLEDGTAFEGDLCASGGEVTGEVVFNTAITGYQEAVTDPSYAGQIITFTYPMVGNYGVGAPAMESDRPQARGVIMREARNGEDAADAEGGWLDWLVDCGVPAITGVDTRTLVRHIRDQGAMRGGIFPAELEMAEARARIEAEPSMTGADFARTVTPGDAIELDGDGPHIVALDTGIKHSIIRQFRDRNCRITLLPCDASAKTVLAADPDLVFLANGPGDPEPCDYAIAATRECIDRGVPTFGICLGHQIMALACGAKTYKMKFGHHGANHPVKDLDSGRVSITSQNHGFAVDPKTLPATLRPTHVSLFDGTLQGLAHVDKPAFCFQGHPEASPGPHDIGYLFDRFVDLMDQAGRAHA